MIERHFQNTRQSLDATRELQQAGKLHRRVQVRLWIMFILSLISFGCIVFEILLGSIDWWVALILILLSILVGRWMARMYKLEWDEEKELVVARRMDWTSASILLLYIIVRVGLRHVLDQLHTDADLTLAITFATLFGVMFGRFLGMTAIVRQTYQNAQTGR